MSKEYKVWTCKIVIPAECELPPGFDYPPRMAAENAIESAGFPVLMNASGWGDSLKDHELEAVQRAEKQGREDIYYAGAMDAPEDVAH